MKRFGYLWAREQTFSTRIKSADATHHFFGSVRHPNGQEESTHLKIKLPGTTTFSSLSPWQTLRYPYVR